MTDLRATISDQDVEVLVQDLERSLRDQGRCYSEILNQGWVDDAPVFDALMDRLAELGHDAWRRRLAHEYIEQCKVFDGRHAQVAVIARHADLDQCIASLQRGDMHRPPPQTPLDQPLPIATRAFLRFGVQCLMAEVPEVPRLAWSIAAATSQPGYISWAFIECLERGEEPAGGAPAAIGRWRHLGGTPESMVHAMVIRSSTLEQACRLLDILERHVPGEVAGILKKMAEVDHRLSATYVPELAERYQQRARAEAFEAPAFTMSAP